MSWEQVHIDQTCAIERMKVFEGWLVRIMDKWGNSISITFVPDKKFDWKI